MPPTPYTGPRRCVECNAYIHVGAHTRRIRCGDPACKRAAHLRAMRAYRDRLRGGRPVRKCAECDKPIPATMRTDAVRCGDPACRNASITRMYRERRRRRAAAIMQGTRCARCNAEIPVRLGVPGRYRRYCTPECQIKYNRELRAKRRKEARQNAS